MDEIDERGGGNGDATSGIMEVTSEWRGGWVKWLSGHRNDDDADRNDGGYSGALVRASRKGSAIHPRNFGPDKIVRIPSCSGCEISY